MLENKIREVFADMVVLKDPQRSEYFSKLSIPSYMRDWLVRDSLTKTGRLIMIRLSDISTNTFRQEKITSNSSSEW